MDISSATSSSATIDTSSVSQSSKTSKSESKGDTSFKDEMEKVSQSDENQQTETTEKKDTETKMETEQKSDKNALDDNNQQQMLDQAKLISTGISITNNLQQNDNLSNAQLMLNRQIADLSMLTGVNTSLDYSNIQMSSDDAKFFSDLVQNTDKTLQNVVADLKGGIEENVQKASQNVKVSSTLMNALSEAVKTNQPFRINLDKDVSIIIKVDKDGALSATFIPGDKAVEEYLRQNISTLRQRFDDQELPYKDLSYSKQKQNQQNRRQNKENENE